MAFELPDGKTARTLPEQVRFLTDKLKEVIAAMGDMKMKIKVVDALPEEGEDMTIYFVPSSDPDLENVFKEYMWIDEQWEMIGTTAVDLSNYATLSGNNSFTGNNNFVNLFVSGLFGNSLKSITTENLLNSLVNIIDASEIIDNKLTQEQFDLITNGKPTFILGTWGSYTNLFVLAVNQVGATRYGAWCNGAAFGSLSIISSNKAISITSSNVKSLYLRSIYSFNGKDVPDFPASSGTFALKYINGVLTWIQE